MNIIITGASRGIGYETARLLGKSNSVLALSRNFRALKSLKKENPELDILKFDITSPDDFETLAHHLQKNYRSLDVIINNAGFLVNKPFEKISFSEVEKIFQTNLFGIMRLIHFSLPWLKKSSAAHIVNIGSMGGFQGSAKFPGLSVYSSSKAALACLSECLAEEFRQDKISVNCLAIGAVQTEMFTEAFPGYKAPLAASQMAEFVAEFSTRGHRYFNGKVLPVSLSTP